LCGEKWQFEIVLYLICFEAELKSEIRISKHETNSNDRNLNDINERRQYQAAFVLDFEHLDFNIVSANLIKWADFRFRIFHWRGIGILAANEYPIQPRVAVGAIVFKDDRVLLVRRAQPPSQDLWAIPGGSVKIGETLQEAAEREIFEETGIIIQALEPVYTFDYIDREKSGRYRFHYVIVDLTADYVRGKPRAGDDAAEARWVSSEEITSLEVSEKTLQLLKTRFNFGLID